ANGCAGRAKVCFCLFQGLVSRIDLRLECVELGVVEKRPPVSPQFRVARLRRLPSVFRLEVSRQRLLELRRKRSRGAHVLRPHNAAREPEAKYRYKRNYRRAPNAVPDHDWPPKVTARGCTSI